MTAGTLAPGALADVAGIAVGHYTDARRPTGCSVVLCPAGAVCGVDVRGGSPGTRETDLLRPENRIEQVHAVLLTGGSAFGLDAAGGVMRWLAERGHGLEVGPARVPIVPAAVLFDLSIGDSSIRPDAAAGHAACEAAAGGEFARSAPVAQGSVGAGSGATVGKLFGPARAMKGGIGTASLRVGGFTVGALVAVNAVGDVVDEAGQIIAGARTADGRALLGSTRALLAGEPAFSAVGTSTTIGVVATDALLTKAQASKLATLAQHGVARSIRPLAMTDGDALFALATAGAGRSGDMTLLGTLAAEVVSAAIRNAVRSAVGLAQPALPAAAELK